PNPHVQREGGTRGYSCNLILYLSQLLVYVYIYSIRTLYYTSFPSLKTKTKMHFPQKKRKQKCALYRKKKKALYLDLPLVLGAGVQAFDRSSVWAVVAVG
uniref:Uncharacterized protein n=1 Tax=Aegilops tauschii subsp. strangulata TaxID=200361 RepID=A0A453R6S1_AEGTS